MLLIGVTPSGMTELDLTCHHDYLEAVIRAGAMPMVLPLTTDEETLSKALDMVDGVLVSGGADIHPRYFNEEILPCCGTILPKRDEMEAYVLKEAVRRNMPMLCICRGMQFINCVLEGSLYQDIPAQYETDMCHSRSDTPNDPVHDVNVVKGTILHSIVKTEVLPVNSRHHQAVKAVSPHCTVSAVSTDGLVEGIEVNGMDFGVAVQWHPESLSDRHEKHQLIFNAFVKACENRK